MRRCGAAWYADCELIPAMTTHRHLDPIQASPRLRQRLAALRQTERHSGLPLAAALLIHGVVVVLLMRGALPEFQPARVCLKARMTMERLDIEREQDEEATPPVIEEVVVRPPSDLPIPAPEEAPEEEAEPDLESPHQHAVDPVEHVRIERPPGPFEVRVPMNRISRPRREQAEAVRAQPLPLGVAMVPPRAAAEVIVEATQIPDFCPPPRYPRRARLKAWEGTVLVNTPIDASGIPLGATVKRSSGHAILDRAAVRAVLSWRFRPATRGGVPVASSRTLRFVFNFSAGD